MYDHDGAGGFPSLRSFRGRSVAGGFKRHAGSDAAQSPVYACISASDLSTPSPDRLTCDSDSMSPLLSLDESSKAMRFGGFTEARTGRRIGKAKMRREEGEQDGPEM